MEKLLRLTGIAGLAVLAVAAQAIVIDDFSSGEYSITANSVNPTAEAVTVGTMIGGQRDAFLQYGSGPQSISSSVSIAAGAVSFFNSGSETTGSLILQYDGFDGESASDGVLTNGTSLGANFSGSNAFQFDFRFIDAGLGSNVTILTTVVSSTGTASFLTTVPNGVNVMHQVAFSNFAGVDFSNVQNVTFQFFAPAASDFTLDSIQTVGAVPGPLAAVPFLVGLASLKRRRKR
jgi:hypothetical protein